MDEAVTALKEKYEREKNLLTEENRKLTTETDKVTEVNVVLLLLTQYYCR